MTSWNESLFLPRVVTNVNIRIKLLSGVKKRPKRMKLQTEDPRTMASRKTKSIRSTEGSLICSFRCKQVATSTTRYQKALKETGYVMAACRRWIRLFWKTPRENMSRGKRTKGASFHFTWGRFHYRTMICDIINDK